MPAATVKPGDVFGRLRVDSCAGRDRNGNRLLVCLCDCGGKTTVRAAALRGGTRSCGCAQRESASLRAKKRNHKHGGAYTVEYRLWHGMRERCSSVNSRGWASYGAKGIRVDPRWDDFAAFLADMGPRPTAKHSLDRWPDGSGNYAPGNVRWATPSEQSRNRKSNVILEHEGRRATMAEWAERTGIDRGVIWHRLHAGWAVERVLSTPVRSKRRKGEVAA